MFLRCIIRPQKLITHEKLFEETHNRVKAGRYIVALPFQVVNVEFRDSQEITFKRFYAFKRRLLQNPELYTQYSALLKNY